MHVIYLYINIYVYFKFNNNVILIYSTDYIPILSNDSVMPFIAFFPFSEDPAVRGYLLHLVVTSDISS